MIEDPVFVLVDMQNDFCKPSFAHGVDPGYDTEATETDDEMADIADAVKNAGAFLERYRESGRDPILIQTLHGEASNSPTWTEKYADRPTPCVPGTEGAEFVPELNAQDSDVVVTKHRYSAFTNTALDTYLDSNDASHLLIGGVSTNVCVESTVRSAFDLNYDVTVLSDCTASTELERHEYSLGNVANHFGEVRESSEIEL